MVATTGLPADETTAPEADESAQDESDDPSAPPDEPVPADPMEVFALEESQIQCTFTDVSPDDWYYAYVAYAQSVGLVTGRSENRFQPAEPMTVAECITLCVRIYECYHGIEVKTAERDPWYETYVSRAIFYGILPNGCENYSDPVRREQAAALFASALPEQEYPAINEITRLTDVSENQPFFPYILCLFRAGVLTGSDKYGTFSPSNTATRAEIVKILAAVIQPTLRVEFQPLVGDLSVFQISQTSAPNFTDVSADAWYAPYVSIQRSLGILNGVGNNLFSPLGTVTIAQAIKVGVEVYEKYFGVEPGEHTDPWYTYYLEKGVAYGLIDAVPASPNTLATRGQVIFILYRTLNPKEYTVRNQIDQIPDVTAMDPFYDVTLTFYRAGIMTGSDVYGTANLYQNITRAELATLLTRLVLPTKRLDFKPVLKVVEAFQYGTSGSGRYPLTGWRIGNGRNVIILSYAIHGWEDNYDRDGKTLVYLADQLKAYLESNYELVYRHDWTVYILRCCNPDGMYDGYTCYGPGRCTTTCYDANGALITGTGCDINRSFPYRFQSYTSARYYNAGRPLACAEAAALSEFTKNAKGSGYNICIDTHGWYTQILTTHHGTVYQSFYRYFPRSSYADLTYGYGYYSAYAESVLGYDGCLFELPYDVYSTNDLVNKGYVTAYISAIAEILTSYRGN